MRVNSLHELAMLPIQNPQSSACRYGARGKTRGHGFLSPLFQAAFGTPQVTADRIGQALEQFLQALLSYRSRPISL